MAQPLYYPHPAPLTVLYSDIDGHTKAGAPVFAGTAGSISVRTNKQGYEFYVHRYYDGDGKQRETYLAGPVGNAEADQKAEVLKAHIEEVKAQVAHLRLLGREGFQLADTKTYATLASLHLHGLFRAGAMLIGSHAFGILLNQLGVKSAAYATEDIDLARREALVFPAALDKSLLDILRESGICFVEAPKLDPREPSTTFKQRGMSRFHVDLLVPSKDESFPTIPVPELQAHATGLPYLAYLLAETQEATLLAREGCCPVRVPLPERFALHKLLVSQLRVGRDSKTEKDMFQAAVILAVLGDRYPGAIEDAAAKLPDSARRYVKKAMSLLRPRLEQDYPRAWEELETALR